VRRVSYSWYEAIQVASRRTGQGQDPQITPRWLVGACCSTCCSALSLAAGGAGGNNLLAVALQDMHTSIVQLLFSFCTARSWSSNLSCQQAAWVQPCSVVIAILHACDDIACAISGESVAKASTQILPLAWGILGAPTHACPSSGVHTFPPHPPAPHFQTNPLGVHATSPQPSPGRLQPQPASISEMPWFSHIGGCLQPLPPDPSCNCRRS
jgi:hypothetical protein